MSRWVEAAERNPSSWSPGGGGNADWETSPASWHQRRRPPVPPPRTAFIQELAELRTRAEKAEEELQKLCDLAGCMRQAGRKLVASCQDIHKATRRVESFLSALAGHLGLRPRVALPSSTGRDDFRTTTPLRKDAELRRRRLFPPPAATLSAPRPSRLTRKSMLLTCCCWPPLKLPVRLLLWSPTHSEPPSRMSACPTACFDVRVVKHTFVDWAALASEQDAARAV